MSKIAIIGLGTMGSAIQERLAGSYDVVGIGREGDLCDIETSDVVIVTVKPQSFLALASELRTHIRDQHVVSIMAGVNIDSIVTGLGTEKVVRTMPNLAIRTGKSLTAWYARYNEEADAMVEPILGMWGTGMQLDSEDQFHAFTALGGSGPAYFYELARLLEVNAQQYGFSETQARTIGIQTFLGAASVVGIADSPSVLVQAVASKGGTTEAALSVFQEMHLADSVGLAVDAAANRSRELSNPGH